MAVQGALKRDAERRPAVRSPSTLRVADILLLERPALLALWRQLFDSDDRQIGPIWRFPSASRDW